MIFLHFMLAKFPKSKVWITSFRCRSCIEKSRNWHGLVMLYLKRSVADFPARRPRFDLRAAATQSATYATHATYGTLCGQSHCQLKEIFFCSYSEHSVRSDLCGVRSILCGRTLSSSLVGPFVNKFAMGTFPPRCSISSTNSHSTNSSYSTSIYLLELVI
jgi:hypothetical protein